MFSELTAALTSAGAIKDSITSLVNLSNEFNKTDLKLKVVELVGEITDLNQQLQQLRQKLSARESVEYVQGVWWKRDGLNQGDPYCPRCLEADDKLIHMQSREIRASQFTEGYFHWACISCKTVVRRNDKPTTEREIPPAPFAV